MDPLLVYVLCEVDPGGAHVVSGEMGGQMEGLEQGTVIVGSWKCVTSVARKLSGDRFFVIYS